MSILEEEVPEGACFYCFHDDGNPTIHSLHTMNSVEVRILAFSHSWRALSETERVQYLLDHPWYSTHYYTWVTREVCDAHAETCNWCRDKYVQPDENYDIPDGPPRGGYHDLTWDGQESYCWNCWNDTDTCERCGGRHPYDNLNTVDGSDSSYCEQCIARVAWWCNDCDIYVWNEECCPGCDNPQQGHCRIEQYGYKPIPVFHSLSEQQTSRITPFMGLELELECKDWDYRVEAANYAWLKGNREGSDNEIDFMYLKKDGSLQCGFEIVTHPCTLEFFQSIDLSWIERLASDYGCTSWRSTTAGMHVHVSRSAIVSRTHLYAFYHLIIDNKEQMVRLAGRDSYQWARFDDVQPKIIKVVKGEMMPQRYEAVNLCNDKTIELRLFRGSLNVRRVLSNLELTHAAVTYTRRLTSHDVINGALLWTSFSTWLHSQSEQYPNLNHYLNLYSI